MYNKNAIKCIDGSDWIGAMSGVQIIVFLLSSFLWSSPQFYMFWGVHVTQFFLLISILCFSQIY